MLTPYDTAVYDEEWTQFPHIRKVDWTHVGNRNIDRTLALKTLTDVTFDQELVKRIETSFLDSDDSVDIEEATVVFPEYSAEEFLKSVYMDRDQYNAIVGLLKTKKNIILQGAPGVGKTFVAKRLAYSMMGIKDVSRVKLVWPGLVLWTGCFEGCWLLLVVLCPLACVLVG